MPKFSVVIPLYNKENFIAATLKSVLQQTFTDFEIIIVDDGSTDESIEKVVQFTDKRIKLKRHKNNQGLSTTRNTGIEHSQGNIIALLDADDLWLPKHLEQLSELSTKFPEASLFGCHWNMKIGSKQTLEPRTHQPQQKPQLILDFFEANREHPLVCPSALAFKKEVPQQIGFFNPTILVGEDTDFLIRANLKYLFAFHPQASCLYNLESENQITASAIGAKKIPDFDFYESQNPQLKKFLDFQRYTYSLKFKQEKNTKRFQYLFHKIDQKNLNKKQQFLINASPEIYNFSKHLKKLFLKFGLLINSH